MISRLRRWLLPRSATARIVVLLSALSLLWLGHQAWRYAVNWRVATLAEASGGGVIYRDRTGLALVLEERGCLPPHWGEIAIVWFNSESSPPIAPEDLRWLAHLPALEDVRLWGDHFHDGHVARLAPLTRLGAVDLSDTAVTDAGLAALAGMRQLDDLDLFGTTVTDAGMRPLATLTSLQKLYLWNTEVTGAGLSELRTLRELKGLSINSDLEAAGFEALFRFPKLNNIAIALETIDDATLDRLLAGLPALREVIIHAQRSRVTPEKVAAFESRGIVIDIETPLSLDTTPAGRE